MGKLGATARKLGALLALLIAFVPVLVQAEQATTAGQASGTAARTAAGAPLGGVERVVAQEAGAEEESEIPGWVWGVVGGTSGAVILAALGYGGWLRRRR